MAKRQSFSEREKMNAEKEGEISIDVPVAEEVQTEVKETVRPMQTLDSAIPTLGELKEKKDRISSEEIPASVPAVCDMVGLTESEKELLIQTRIGRIFEASNLANPPALVKYRISPTQPYVLALIDGDCMCIKEAWEYYKVNVATADPMLFLDMLKHITKKPVKVYSRVAEIDLN